MTKAGGSYGIEKDLLVYKDGEIAAGVLASGNIWQSECPKNVLEEDKKGWH